MTAGGLHRHHFELETQAASSYNLIGSAQCPSRWEFLERLQRKYCSQTCLSKHNVVRKLPEAHFISHNIKHIMAKSYEQNTQSQSPQTVRSGKKNDEKHHQL